MPLTEAFVRTVKPETKARKYADGHGLYLFVSPAGGKLWRLKYRVGGREKTLSFGKYPIVGLKDARDMALEARKALAGGVDPGAEKKAIGASVRGGKDSFEAVAREWHGKLSAAGKWTPLHAERILLRLEQNVFPYIGALPVDEVTSPQVLKPLRVLEERGCLDTAHRLLQTCGQVFRYAVATGRCERDTAADLRGAIPPAKETPRPAILEPAAIGELLRALDGYQGTLPVMVACKLAPMLFVRPGELRRMEWSELDLAGGLWVIPASKMKMRVEHRVPLARQAVALLRELHELTGQEKFCFPSLRTAERPMSENTVNAVLRRLGYTSDQMCGHGFRALASTRLYEMGFSENVIEAQLAHSERNRVKAAYCRAEYLDERRAMMQRWADYLDRLKAGI